MPQRPWPADGADYNMGCGQTGTAGKSGSTSVSCGRLYNMCWVLRAARFDDVKNIRQILVPWSNHTHFDPGLG